MPPGLVQPKPSQGVVEECRSIPIAQANTYTYESHILLEGSSILVGHFSDIYTSRMLTDTFPLLPKCVYSNLIIMFF